MAIGAGTNPYGGQGGAPLPGEPQGTEPQRIARAAERLAGAQAPPAHEQWTPVTLTATGSKYITSNRAAVSMLTVQVFTGTVDIVLGDQTGQTDPTIPYWRIGSIGVPVHIPLTTQPHDVTLFANGGVPATCSVFLHTPT